MKTVTLDNQQFTYEQLETMFNLPKDVVIEGCHTYSTNVENIEFLKTVEAIKTFEVFGFGNELSKLIAEDEEIQNNVYRIFDKNYLTINKLISLGFGQTQAKNYFDGLHKTYNSGIPFRLIVKSLNIPGCGETITEQFTRFFYDLPFETSGLTKKVWNELMDLDASREFTRIFGLLKSYGYDVINTLKVEETNSDSIKVVLTGSPKAFGFKTKAEFLSQYPNLVEVKKIQDADFLVTDDLESKSSKMKDASKYRINVKTYNQF